MVAKPCLSYRTLYIISSCNSPIPLINSNSGVQLIAGSNDRVCKLLNDASSQDASSNNSA
jgi:hypothetical protein